MLSDGQIAAIESLDSEPSSTGGKALRSLYFTHRDGFVKLRIALRIKFASDEAFEEHGQPVLDEYRNVHLQAVEKAYAESLVKQALESKVGYEIAVSRMKSAREKLRKALKSLQKFTDDLEAAGEAANAATDFANNFLA